MKKAGRFPSRFPYFIIFFTVANIKAATLIRPRIPTVSTTASGSALSKRRGTVNISPQVPQEIRLPAQSF